VAVEIAEVLLGSLGNGGRKLDSGTEAGRRQPVAGAHVEAAFAIGLRTALTGGWLPVLKDGQ